MKVSIGVVTSVLAATVLLGVRPFTGEAQTGPPRPPLVIESVAGRDNFERYCASCHGLQGRGDGPVAAALSTRPADLTSLARRNGGAFPRERVVEYVAGTGRGVAAHGSNDMPVWGPIFHGLDPSDTRVGQRIDNVVRFIESLQAPSTAVNDPGSQLFRTYCATCHGTTGRGNGPMAEQLRRMPPDLTQYTARNGGVFPSERVHRIIDGRDVPSHGDPAMPVWGDAFRRGRGDSSEESVRARIDAIVKYLAGIQERAAHVFPLPGHTPPANPPSPAE
jgi:mono/diheme cytochrome c family protein